MINMRSGFSARNTGAASDRTVQRAAALFKHGFSRHAHNIRKQKR